MPTHLALLRGVNVGGRNRVPMAPLVRAMTAAGFGEARHYIQSGNLVFTPPAGMPAPSIATAIQHLVLEQAGVVTPVVVRTARAVVAAAAADNPFLEAGADPEHLHVGFFRDLPDDDEVEALDPDRSPGDAYVVRGAEIFIHAPGGLGSSRLTVDWLDRSLGTITTIRGWATVTKLAGWLRAPR